MNQETQKQPETRRHQSGYSGKRFVLAVASVMATVLLIYFPAIAIYRINWLNDRSAAAYTAALVAQAASGRPVPKNVRRQILDSIGAKSVVLKVDQSRHLLAVSDTPEVVDRHIDLRVVSDFNAIMGAFETIFLWSGQNLIRVIGPAPMGGESIEIVLEERLLRQAMFEFSIHMLMASLLIIGSAGLMMFFALKLLLARSMRRITLNTIEKA